MQLQHVMNSYYAVFRVTPKVFSVYNISSLGWFHCCFRISLNQSCILGDHVGNPINDWVCDAKLLVNEFIGLFLVPEKKNEKKVNKYCIS